MKKILFLLYILLTGFFSAYAQQQPARAMSSVHLEFDEHVAANDSDIIEFALITDTHRYGPTADMRDSEENIQAFIRYCDQHPELEFALYGGDFMNAYDTNHDQALWCLQSSQNDFAPLTIPFYTTKGNHDCNGKQWKGNQPDNTQIITDEEYYQLFSPLSVSNPNYHPEGIVVDQEKPHGNYYYRDFEKQRFRLIMLNNYDRDSLEYYGYHGRQMKWLAEVALDFSKKENPSDWCFIIIGHAFSINHAKNAITRLMHAYVRGQDFSDSDSGYHYGGKYSQQARARLVAMFGGHFHDDIYWNWDGYNMISFSRGFATGGEVETDDRFCFDHLVLNRRTQTLEDRRIGRGQSRLFSYGTHTQLSPVISFEDVDGLGAYTMGGNGGRIIHVTNLNDDGKGSLRWAIGQQGRRTIVFDVAGTIELKSPLVITNDSITLAGQTSAQEGITLSGAPLQVEASEVVIRYLTLENSLTDGHFGQRGLILNHITTRTPAGTAISIRRTEDVTVQDCRFLGQPGNESPAVIAGGYKATYYNNLWIDCINALKFPDEEGTNRWIHVVRNVIVNWRDHSIYGGKRQGEFSVEDNYLIPGHQTANFHILEVAQDGTARYHVTNNVMKGYERFNRKNAGIVRDRSAIPYYPLAADTLERPGMSPVQRPHSADFASSCMVVAAFHNKPIFKHPSKEHTYHTLLREAGSGYRPQAVCLDSLYSGDVEGYARRLVVPERTIVILSENDVHCAIDKYPYLAGLRDLIAADTAWVGITSSGDYLQGGLIGSMSNGQAIADIMQCINYDAITVGNHEFDFPFSTTRKLLNDISAPVVCANLRDAESDTLVFMPYVIRQYGRRRVAFVGVTTPTIEQSNHFALLDEKGKKPKYDFSPRNLYQRVQHAVDDARRNGADYVIVLSHLGERNESGITSHTLVAATHGIDAVLDGHTHSYVPSAYVPNQEGHPTLITQTGSQFSHIGKLVIDPNGQLYSEMIDPSTLMFRDPLTSRMVEIANEQYMSAADKHIGISRVSMRRFNDWKNDDDEPDRINAGDLVTDALRYVTKADLAWINAGSIRKGIDAGDLNSGTLVELLPYENYVCSFQISGAKIEKLVYALFDELTTIEGKINPVSGIRVVLKQQKKRYAINQLEILNPETGKYEPVDPHQTYTIATTNYCINSHHKKLLKLRDSDIKTTTLLYSEALAQYITDALGGVVEASSIAHKNRIVLR